MTIAAIFGYEPNRKDEYPMSYQVGFAGVTEIKTRTENFGDHGIGWFDVYKGEDLMASMAHRAVSEVRYVQ